MNILATLRDQFSRALGALGIPASDLPGLTTLVLPSQDAKFGDYQANCAMPLGKRLGKPPREIAQQIIAALDVAEWCEPPEIAGPGFINLRLKDDWLAAQIRSDVARRRALGRRRRPASPRTIVVDYSSPNVAKPMHVGHIRSTVIGDALYRILKFLGHHAISDNHLGDWGTQFGMIIYGYKHFVDRESLGRNSRRRADTALQARELARRISRDAQTKDSRASKQRIAEADAARLRAGHSPHAERPERSQAGRQATASMRS